MLSLLEIVCQKDASPRGRSLAPNLWLRSTTNTAKTLVANKCNVGHLCFKKLPMFANLSYGAQVGNKQSMMCLNKRNGKNKCLLNRIFVDERRALQHKHDSLKGNTKYKPTNPH